MRRIAAIVAALIGLGAIGWSTPDPGATAAGSGGLYTPIAPWRAVDTRFVGLTAAGQTLTVHVGAPAGAVAVGVNITIAGNEAPGFLTAWSGVGAKPNTSIVNTLQVDDAIANFALVPVGPGGTIAIWPFMTTGIVVDVMGYVEGGGTTTTPPPGITARITGYSPGYSMTSVVGDVTNGGSSTIDVRVDMHCPDGTVETDYSFDLEPGLTLGWEVMCDGLFSSGGYVTWVQV